MKKTKQRQAPRRKPLKTPQPQRASSKGDVPPDVAVSFLAMTALLTDDERAELDAAEAGEAHLLDDAPGQVRDLMERYAIKYEAPIRAALAFSKGH